MILQLLAPLQLIFHEASGGTPFFKKKIWRHLDRWSWTRFDAEWFKTSSEVICVFVRKAERNFSILFARIAVCLNFPPLLVLQVVRDAVVVSENVLLFYENYCIWIKVSSFSMYMITCSLTMKLKGANNCVLMII